jgi:hypothetical protein
MNAYNIDNPFSVTKATEFSDNQINDYWVDNSRLLRPNEFLPKYVLGGKGCGKTHLLRYHSFPLQKIRRGNFKEIINIDKYIGIYSILDGIRSSNFKGKGVDEEQWKSVFEYYFELYICEGLLQVTKEIFCDNISGNYSEKEFTNAITKLFYNNNHEKIEIIDDVLEKLSLLRRKIDKEIVNAAFTRKLDVQSVTILFSPGDLLFKIPKLLTDNIESLRDVKFIYILDEYEKLFEWQKVFVNTLVWEKKPPCTFWIGARRYGYTNMQTKAGEKLKLGSEYQHIFLDEEFQANEQMYKEFAKKLYLRRLESLYPDTEAKQIEIRFSKKFEEYSDDKIINSIIEKHKDGNFNHIKHLRSNILNALKKGTIKALKEKEVDALIIEIVSNTDNNPLEQKYKIYLLYKEWANRKGVISLQSIVDRVNKEYDLFLAQEKSEFENIREKYKSDLLAQLSYENKIKNTCYSGIDKFIELSWGNPRVFLVILKSIIEKSDVFGEKPLENGSVISLETQFLGVYETSKWFYQDAEIIGETGKNLYRSLWKLSDLLQLYRFSDKPTETSVSSFNFGLDEISEEALEYVKLIEAHSLIVNVEGRKQRNSGRKEITYQLNKILSPFWNLPIVRRGIADLNKPMVEAIFNPAENNQFDILYKEMKSRYSAPFFGKTSVKIKAEYEDGSLNLFHKSEE